MTIREVAELAGVSDATVSRVLNGRTNVTEKTRARVLSVIERTGYRPNLLGRNLRRSRTGNILVLLPSVANDFYSLIIRGIEDVAREEGYYALVCNTYANRETEAHYLSLLKNRLADGVIALASAAPPREIKALGSAYPYVFCSEYFAGIGIPAVTIDNRKAARDAVEHLLSAGHREIAFIGGAPEYLSSAHRKEGYTQALHAAGIVPRGEYMVSASYSFGGGIRACDRLMELDRPPTAVFAVSDSIAVGFIRRLSELGQKAGEDVAVVGFDDTAMAAVYTPSVTTIAQPRRELGRAAMRLLLGRIAGEKTEEFLIFPHALIPRESSGRRVAADNPLRGASKGD